MATCKADTALPADVVAGLHQCQRWSITQALAKNEPSGRWQSPTVTRSLAPDLENARLGWMRKIAHVNL